MARSPSEIFAALSSPSEGSPSEAEWPSDGPINPEDVNTGSLDILQNDGQRKIMDVVDKLRRTGLSSVLQLPQLVVCGDQSSGKSSVLEAITEIPFPRKENLCTRFATEIVMRRDPVSSISTKITPDKNRSAADKQTIEKFRRSIKDFSELPALIEEATAVMGLDESGSQIQAFSRDVLSIEITGPRRPQLTLVDLPGLIHSENRQQSKNDVELIKDLVEEYITSKRTIILAIVSAKNDYANQIILDKARRVDKSGSRTLGIITKPDFLREGSDNEQTWIDLAMNKDIWFDLGWHILKNRGDGEGDHSFAARNASESRFFNKGSYRALPRENVGIETLRTKLSQLLNTHLTQELPGLKKELDMKLLETTEDLDKLGAKRSTAREQRQFLMNIAVEAQKILGSAVTGIYTLPFFADRGTHDTSAKTPPDDAPDNYRRLRALVENLNVEFDETMRTRGCRYAIMDAPGATQDPKECHEHDSDGSGDISNTGHLLSVQKTAQKMTREEAIDWVLGVLRRSRGQELPGTFNPSLIGQLFGEQSAPWAGIAKEHTNCIADNCASLVRTTFEEVTTSDVTERLFSLHVGNRLETIKGNALDELSRILLDNSRAPLTYNHYYTTTIQKMRQTKQNRKLRKAQNKCKSYAEYDGVDNAYIRPDELLQVMEQTLQQDMDRFSAEEALDSQIAYYKCARKYFVDVVAHQVIERHLVAYLPDMIFTANTVLEMTDEEVKFVAGEADEITRKRSFLEARKSMLESGQKTFKFAMGAVR